MTDQPADLGTRGGRIRHIRLSLAVRFGNLSLERFGEVVAQEESRLTSKPVAAYKASTVKRWEAGAQPSWDAGRAIALLGGKSLEWLASGDTPKPNPTTAPNPWPGYGDDARPTLPEHGYRVPDADMAEPDAAPAERARKKGKGR